MGHYNRALALTTNVTRKSQIADSNAPPQPRLLI